MDRLSEGDTVEVFSQSMGGWQPAVVVERNGDHVALQYGADGDRSRIVDLTASDLSSYFRVPSAQAQTVAMFPTVSAGCRVEVFSQSMGGWQPAVVVERNGDHVALQYGADGDRSRIVDLTASDLSSYFRIRPVQQLEPTRKSGQRDNSDLASEPEPEPEPNQTVSLFWGAPVAEGSAAVAVVVDNTATMQDAFPSANGSDEEDMGGTDSESGSESSGSHSDEYPAGQHLADVAEGSDEADDDDDVYTGLRPKTPKTPPAVKATQEMQTTAGQVAAKVASEGAGEDVDGDVGIWLTADGSLAGDKLVGEMVDVEGHGEGQVLKYEPNRRGNGGQHAVMFDNAGKGGRASVRKVVLGPHGLPFKVLATAAQDNTGSGHTQQLLATHVESSQDAGEQEGYAEFDIGEGKYLKGDWRGAATAYKAAITHGYPYPAELHHLRGLCFRRMKLYRKAFGAFDEAIAASNSLDEQMWLDRAKAHQALGRNPKALLDLQQVLKLKPAEPEAKALIDKVLKEIAAGTSLEPLPSAGRDQVDVSDDDDDSSPFVGSKRELTPEKTSESKNQLASGVCGSDAGRGLLSSPQPRDETVRDPNSITSETSLASASVREKIRSSSIRSSSLRSASTRSDKSRDASSAQVSFKDRVAVSDRFSGHSADVRSRLADESYVETGDPVEIFSKTAGSWQPAQVLAIDGENAHVQYGDRNRVVSLLDPELLSYFRLCSDATRRPTAPSFAATSDIATASLRAEPSSFRSDVSSTMSDLSDLDEQPEIFSKSLGGWQPAVIIGAEGNNVQVQYGDRTRVLDITDPALSNYFRFRPISPRFSGKSNYRDTPVEKLPAKPTDPDGLDEFDTGSSSNEDEYVGSTFKSRITITQEDICEVFSKSSGRWQTAQVLERDGDELVVKYAGDRSRVVDLKAVDLHTYFRVRKRRPEDFVVGDDVEVFSAGVTKWLNAEVVEVNGLDVTLEYGDRQKIVSLEDPEWPKTLRNATMAAANIESINDAVVEARRKYHELQHDYEGMKDMLTDEVKEEFEYELQNLREERRDLEREALEAQEDVEPLTQKDIASRVAAAERHNGVLDMRDEMLGNSGTSYLAHLVVQSPMMTEVLLEDNDIGDDGAAAIGAAVYKSAKVMRLDLSSNDITAAGAAALAAVVELSQTLAVLSLSDNAIKDEGVQVLAAALARKTHTQAEATAEKVLRDLLEEELNAIIKQEMHFAACRYAQYRPPAVPPIREFVEDVVRTTLREITTLDEPLVELFVDMLLSDDRLLNGNTAKDDIIEDIALKLVDLEAFTTVQLAEPTVFQLIDQTWAGATPRNRPSVQVREQFEAKIAVEQWKPAGSTGKWTEDRNKHSGMRGEVLNVDERDNSCEIKFYADAAVVWYPATALWTQWDDSHGDQIKLADANEDITAMLEKLLIEHTNLENLLARETAAELKLMQAAETKALESDMQTALRQVHEQKLSEQIVRLERHGFSRKALTRMAETVPSQLKPELVRLGMTPTDAVKLMDMLLPVAKRKVTTRSGMDAVAAWLNRENVGPPPDAAEVITAKDLVIVPAAVAAAAADPRLKKARAVRNFTMTQNDREIEVNQGDVMMVTKSGASLRWWSGYPSGGDETPGEFLANAVDLLSLSILDGVNEDDGSDTGEDLRELGLLGSGSQSISDDASPALKVEAMLDRFRGSLKQLPALSNGEAIDLETKLRLKLEERSLNFEGKRGDLFAVQEQRRFRHAAALAAAQVKNMHRQGFGGDQGASVNHAVAHAKATLNTKLEVNLEGSSLVRNTTRMTQAEWWAAYGRRAVLGAYGGAPKMILHRNKQLIAGGKGTDPALHRYSVGEEVEVYSKSLQQWVKGLVVSVQGRNIQVKYEDRMKELNLEADDLKTALSVTAPERGFIKAQYRRGDRVEVYSETYGEWLHGKVTAVEDGKAIVMYGDRTKIFDLADPKLLLSFRSVMPAVPTSKHLCGSSLTSLDVSENAITSEGAAALAKAAEWSALSTLKIGDNSIGAQGAAALAMLLASSEVLTCLNVRGNSIGDSGASALAAAMKSSRGLLELDVADNHITFKGARDLGSALVKGVVQTLVLGGNPLGVRGVRAVATAMVCCGSVTALDVGSTNCGPIGVADVLQALEHCPGLSYLNLEQNALGCKGAQHLAVAMRGATVRALKTLVLHGNDLGDEGAICIAEALGRPSAEPMAGGSVRPSRAGITSLDLSNNGLSAAGAEECAKAIGRCTTLASLALQLNDIGLRGLAAVEAAVSVSSSMTELLYDDPPRESVRMSGAQVREFAIVSAKIGRATERTRQRQVLREALAGAGADDRDDGPRMLSGGVSFGGVDGGQTAAKMALKASAAEAQKAHSELHV